MLQELNKTQKFIAIVVLLVVATLSLTVVTNYATSPEVHAATIETLDDKKVTAMELTAAVAASSTAIVAIPGDSTTPIATQLSELTTPLLIIVCAIYLEKFLLTTIGYVSFTFLIPFACVLLVIHIFFNKEMLKVLAIKLAVFAIVIFAIIPVSVKVTMLIEQTFDQTIQATFETADNLSSEVNTTDDEDSNWFTGLVSGIGEAVSELGQSAENALSVFIDAIAVLIITTCVIPIAVMFFVIWIVKMLFGFKIALPQETKWFPHKKRGEIPNEL